MAAAGVWILSAAAAAQEAGPAGESAVSTPVLTPLNILLILLLLAAVVLALRLWQALGRLTRQHDRETRLLVSRSNELEATLSSMVEGVLAVDMHQRVLSVNDAAALLLNIRTGRAVGRHVDEVVDSAPLRRLITQALETDRPLQSDIELPALSIGGARPPERGHRLYQVQGAVLRDTEGRRIGALIVLHDVTRLRRLEVVRRDFVANASHEIKTPVTAIKAAAETLLDNHETERDPRAVRQFVGVIARQADRLQALVEDLLSLARIEHDTEQQRIPRSPRRIAEVLGAAADHCRSLAASHAVQIELRCPDDLMAPVNPQLLEQAVVNLLDNAIKYGGDGRPVRIAAEQADGELVISVRDRGPGIAPEHLPRVFERFYRTDKARSRQLGGTGLGLSIVRHVALAHGGRATADSTPGRGATFRLHLPLR